MSDRDEVSTTLTENSLIPVVAIGASAGGLQALYDLLENLPTDPGMGYVVIQHLSPNHESILPELLSSKTKMPVHKVENGLKIQPDQVYVIPPKTFMSIVDSKLILSDRIKTEGAHYSIDYFLKALAPVYQAKAIAVILSGTGSDGTACIQAIKDNGGITFAQDETAAFSGMPKAASDSGFTDFVLPCKRIAQELTLIVKSAYGILTINEVAEANDTELKKIQVILHNKRGVDFGYYKKTTVNRRILRRMALNKFKVLSEYTKFLRENSDEVELLYKDLLINVTSFFREPAVYEALSKKIFPALFKGRRENDVLRIWTPACANGEEAYSLAICLFDFLQNKAVSTPIQIFGTDLNEVAIDKARKGIYHKSALENVSDERLNQYFIKTDGHYQIIKPIRDTCIFATHNLLKDPPFSRMDLISCQNVMIYLESNPQKNILRAFNYSLKSTGYLLLGKSETIGNSTELFAQVDKEFKIYSRKETPPGSNTFDFSTRNASYRVDDMLNAESDVQLPADIDIEKETDRLLLSRYVPASIVVNKDFQILRFHGDTSTFLQPSSGRASLHLLKMVKNEIVLEIKNLINRVKKENISARKDDIQFQDNGTLKEISIEVVPIKSPARESYYLILFQDKKAAQPTNKSTGPDKKIKPNIKEDRVNVLEQQLTDARDYMKTLSEEFEATREELQSANEEVLSSNEELQSINEELETSKEELQSTNEELISINEEMQQRNNDLREVSGFLETVVETIRQPLLVLSQDMRIRKANKAFYLMFKTNIDRIEGNYFFEIENGMWSIEDLHVRMQSIINKPNSNETFEKTIIIPGLGEKLFSFSLMQMKQEGVKDSRILILLDDITIRKKTEMAFGEERFRLLIENAFDIITIYSKEGAIIFQSSSVEKLFGFTANENLGKNIFEFSLLHPDDVSKHQKLFTEVLSHSDKSLKSQFRLRHKNGTYRTMDVIFRNLLDNPHIKGIVANYHNTPEIISG